MWSCLLRAGEQDDECGKLVYWFYVCRPATQAWEEHHSSVSASVGFKRLLSSPVAFYHSERDLVGVVHSDDFVFVGVDRDLDFARHVCQRTIMSSKTEGVWEVVTTTRKKLRAARLNKFHGGGEPCNAVRCEGNLPQHSSP